MVFLDVCVKFGPSITNACSISVFPHYMGSYCIYSLCCPLVP